MKFQIALISILFVLVCFITFDGGFAAPAEQKQEETKNFLADIWDGIWNKVTNLHPGVIKSGVKSCPDIPAVGQLVGKTCGDSNAFYYYTCCGNQDCCINFQDWVWGAIFIVSALIILSIIVNILRCLFCCR